MSGISPETVAEEPQPARRSANRKPIRSVAQRGTVRAAEPQREVRKHKRTDATGSDAFYVPKHLIPKGYAIEWKVLEVVNKPIDPNQMIEHGDQGWKPATASQFPTLMPPGTPPGKSIVRKGMQLMIRPDYLSEEAKAEDLQIAREQVRDKLRSLTQTAPGEMDRKVQRIKRSYERAPVEDDGS